MATKFVTFSKAEFEAALAKAVRKNVDRFEIDATTVRIKRAQEGRGENEEYSYRIYVGVNKLYVKVNSSVSPRTDCSRDYASDAIRINLIDGGTQNHKGDDKAIIEKQAHVKRITTWATNVEKRITEMFERVADTVQPCECGAVKVQRDGKFGPFFSCVNFVKGHPELAARKGYTGVAR
jgi:hypothetical protein